MANKYLWSGAGGAATGNDWANAYTTMAAAAAGMSTGDDLWVAHDHAESTNAAIAITFPGTTRTMCVDRGGSVPPVAADLRATAVVRTTGNSNIALRSTFTMQGIIFEAGNGASGTASILLADSGSPTQVYRNCIFRLQSTGTASRIQPAQTAGGRVSVIDCKAWFQNTSQGFTAGLGAWTWTGTAAGDLFDSGSALPTTLIRQGSSSRFTFSGVDLSQLGSGKTIVDAAAPLVHPFAFRNCKLGASVTVAATPTQGQLVAGVDVVGCSSAGNVRRDERYSYRGSLFTETTIIRDGGASDGTTAYSHRVATTANARREFAFECFERAVWNEDVGVSKTLTIHILTDNVTLTDAEVWVEAQYLGSSAAPVASIVSDEPATPLTAGANQADDSATAWTTTGLATPVKQKLEVTFTPQMAGPIIYRVRVGKLSTTVYIDPVAELS